MGKGVFFLVTSKQKCYNFRLKYFLWHKWYCISMRNFMMIALSGGSVKHILMSLDLQSTENLSPCIFMCMLHAWLWFCRTTFTCLDTSSYICILIKRRSTAWLLLCLTLPWFVIRWYKWIYCTKQKLGHPDRSIKFRQIIQNRGKWWKLIRLLFHFLPINLADTTDHSLSSPFLPVSSWLKLGFSVLRWKSSSSIREGPSLEWDALLTFGANFGILMVGCSQP